MSKVLGPWLLGLTNNNLPMMFALTSVIILIILPAAAFTLKAPSNQKSFGKGGGTEEAPLLPDILSRPFITVWVFACCIIVAGLLIISSQAPVYEDLLAANGKLVIGAGATLVAAASICNGFGRIAWARLSDSIGTLDSFRVLFVSEIIAVIAFLCAPGPLAFY